jgi:hypothetical protein
MAPDGAPTSRQHVLRWLLAGAALAAILVVAAVVGVVVWRGALSWHGLATAPQPGPPPAVDPRVTYAGPYANVRPEVRYVGDERCAECHRDIAELYSKHPMSRTLTPIARLAPSQSYDASVKNPFEAFWSRFRVERDGDSVRHRWTRLDVDGRPIFENVQEVAYAIGSGVHGYSYLADRDGFVFQTPVSWFEQKRFWGLSPGFSPDLLAGRPVAADCLFCHANRARPVAGTFNRYEEPLSDGSGIGCERCHGPGELHVRNAELDAATHIDPTIVNPARLPPPLREAVCEQCHLEGAASVVRRGRQAADFRPGLPLESVVSVFVWTAAGGADRKAINHVVQMCQSGCFRGGEGDDRIGCISCHDPHDFVEPERRVAWYRAACRNCHGRKQPDCTVPEGERRRSSPDDSCIQCHMPPYGTSDVPHVASTDHRIPRRPDQADAPDDEGARATALMTLFHHDHLDERDPEYRRDLALALAAVAEEQDGPGEAAARAADALLDEAVHKFPDDVRALEANGRRAIILGRMTEALASFEASLANVPNREDALAGAGTAAHELGKDEAALAYWRRLATVDPWVAIGPVGLADILASRQQWAEARDQAGEWVRLAPQNPDARKLLIRCRLKTGDRAGAEAELKTVKALQPGSDAGLDLWFSRQQR